jgi:hypothetical protein
MFQSLRSRVIVAGVIAAAALVATGSAGAGTPAREDLGLFPYGFSVDCEPYGFDFGIDVEGQESVVVETFYGASGEPIRIVIHSSFRETDTNTMSGKSLPFRGRMIRTFDLAAGTRTDVGTMFLMTDPGSGIVIQDVGRVAFDASFHVSFEAGRHEVLHGGAGSHLDELACTALASD